MDFCHGHVQFPSMYLSVPGGLSTDLKKYWNHQPIRFNCSERNPENGKGPGRDFFCVVFQYVGDDEEASEESSDDESEGTGSHRPSSDVD